LAHLMLGHDGRGWAAIAGGHAGIPHRLASTLMKDSQ
jgi:hypothetical protein